MGPVQNLIFLFRIIYTSILEAIRENGRAMKIENIKIKSLPSPISHMRSELLFVFDFKVCLFLQCLFL